MPRPWGVPHSSRCRYALVLASGGELLRGLKGGGVLPAQDALLIG